MSRRRTALAIALAVTTGLATVPSSPARADSTIVVRGGSFGSDLNGVFGLDCDDPFELAQGLTFTYPATTSPLGARALRVAPSFTGVGGGWSSLVDSLDAVTTFTMDVRTTVPNEGRVVVSMASEVPEETTHRWVGVSEPVSIPAASGYQTVSGLGRTFDWTKYNGATPVGSAPSQTLDAFLEGHGGDREGQLIMTFGCNGVGFDTDRWRIGDVSNVTSFDLEGVASSVMTRVSVTRVVYQGAVKMSTALRLAGELSPGGTVALQARQPDGSFSTVGSATTNAQGAASLVVRPTRTTTYRWSFAGTDTIDPSVSVPITVRVAPILTATPSTRRIPRGGALVVSGKVTPVLGGTTVTLWRYSGVGPVRLATAKVKANGTYRVSRTLDLPGKYEVFTSIPKVGTFLSATSRTVTVTVTRQNRRAVSFLR
jgi:hypothetical protein